MIKRFGVALAIMVVAMVILISPSLLASEDVAQKSAEATTSSGQVTPETSNAPEMELIDLIVVPILLLLATTAVTVARIKNLWAAVMFIGIYSFLGASWMLILDAPDVAFTEAAVGAGISTFLMLGTLALTGRDAKPSTSNHFPALLVVTITGCALVYGTLDMPHFGSPEAPGQVYPVPSFVEKSQPDMGHGGLPNVVTAVLASYRGYDTLGETAVIFTAGIAVLLILRRPTKEDEEVMAQESSA